jgi:hypothetical protein
MGTGRYRWNRAGADSEVRPEDERSSRVGVGEDECNTEPCVKAQALIGFNLLQLRDDKMIIP